MFGIGVLPISKISAVPLLLLQQHFIHMLSSIFNTRYILIFIFLLILSSLLGFIYEEMDVFNYVEEYVPIQTKYEPNRTIETGTEIIFVYIGSSSCTYATQDENIEMVQDIKVGLQRRFEKKDLSFLSIGIAKDLNPRKGIEHLQHFGYFDEVIIGGGWRSTGLIHYVWNDKMAAAIPQISVVRRDLEVSDGRINITNSKLLINRNGISSIRTWFNNGFSVTNYH